MTPGQVTTGEYNWTVQRGDRQIGCAVQDHGDGAGGEVHIGRDGKRYVTRAYARLAEAVQHAHKIRRNLERDGWTIVAEQDNSADDQHCDAASTALTT